MRKKNQINRGARDAGTFVIVFIIVCLTGLWLSSQRVRPLLVDSATQTRSSRRSRKMLKFLADNYPGYVARDHFFWISEDSALGDCRMVIGQYLEYLPRGAARVIKDTARIYFLPEEDAYRICSKYGLQLIIVRRHFLELAKLGLLLTEAETTSEPYMRLTAQRNKKRRAKEVSITWTDKGKNTLLARMLSQDKAMRHFALIYADGAKDGIADIAVYKVR
ncbi:MAG: hypothetical protein ACE5GG_02260 [Candidatus Omnitrophota bacterium]